MKLFLALISATAALMGCATNQPAPSPKKQVAASTTQAPAKPKEPIVIGPTPVCSSPDECQAMWAKAATVLPTITQMRLAMMNDTYMETYPGVRGIAMHAKAVKKPIGNGKYEIAASISCRTSSGCGDLEDMGMALFNTVVDNAGAPLRPGAKPATKK